QLSPPSPLQCPEEVRVGAGVARANLPIGGDDVCLEQVRCRHPVPLGEATEATTLDESCDSDGGAAATLDVPPTTAGHGVVGVQPHLPGADAHRREWPALPLAVLRG